MSFVQEFLSKGCKPLHDKKLLNMLLPVLAVFCAVVPLEISHLVFALTGALAFAVIQSIQPKKKRSKQTPKNCQWKSDCIVNEVEHPHRHQLAKKNGKLNHKVQSILKKDYEEVRKPSTVPIVAPIFKTLQWEEQIQELLKQISPTAEDDKIVARLAAHVRATIAKSIPEVEVVGFACGDLKRNKAFGVAVPEVDIVANINPRVLESRLKSKMSNKMQDSKGSTEGHRLRKSAIRAFTDALVSDGGFKFRRSAFRNDEPKVTLLAPQSLTGCDHAIPFDFSVNAINPLHNAALMMECNKMEPRAKELILLVKRWAKDRGICHAAKGHLSPYSWTLLCIFFLQAREEPLLPPLDRFKKASVLCGAGAGGSKDRGAQSTEQTRVAPCLEKTAGVLFKEFMIFYSTKFDWRSEAVSVRTGKRSKPGLGLPLHIIVCDSGETEVGPSIEDPFDETLNLGSSMGSVSLSRLQQELSRANQMCSDGSSLAQLLVPWAPETEAAHTDDSSQ